MVAFFAIAAAAAAVTAGSSAAHVKLPSHEGSRHQALKMESAAPSFDDQSFDSVSDCLTAASRDHVPLDACHSKPGL